MTKQQLHFSHHHPATPQATIAGIIISPLGKLGIKLNANLLLTQLVFLPDNIPIQAPLNQQAQKIMQQLTAYFLDPQRPFQLDYALTGTPFQQRVWHALTEIPAGQTLTYGELAIKLKTGPRAIGQACRTNPIPVIIPCHRVVAANHLGGYAGTQTGRLMQIKEWLLKHEESCFG